MERRGFIKKCLRWVAWLFGGSLLAYPAFSFMTFRKGSSRTIIFHLQDQTGPVNFKEGVYLIKEPNGAVALSSRCTHLGCTINFDTVSDRFTCPCHGSVFDRPGKRLAGPAQRDLNRVPLTMKANGDAEAVVETG